MVPYSRYPTTDYPMWQAWYALVLVTMKHEGHADLGRKHVVKAPNVTTQRSSITGDYIICRGVAL